MDKPFTKEKFMSFYRGKPSEKAASDCFDAVAISLAQSGILSPMTLIGALATVRTETRPSQPYVPCMEDITPSQALAAYTGIIGNRANTLDGYIYRGGGIAQLTGRDNYIHYGSKIGVDLLNSPSKILELGVGARVLAEFFKDHNIPQDCNNRNWLAVRTKYNGINRKTGLPNGWVEFSSIINQFLSV